MLCIEIRDFGIIKIDENWIFFNLNKNAEIVKLKFLLNKWIKIKLFEIIKFKENW